MISRETVIAIRAALCMEPSLVEHVQSMSETGERPVVRRMIQSVEWRALEMAAVMGAVIALQRANEEAGELIAANAELMQLLEDSAL